MKDPKRRELLKLLGALPLLGGALHRARAHAIVGPVNPPLVLPPTRVLRHDGMQTTLQALLRGKTTAMQLMFTACGETCPLQGVLFNEVQQGLPNASDIQLLSLSINPLSDDPRSMSAWLKKFDAGSRWIGAIPAVREWENLRKALQLRTDRLESHSSQVYLFNKQGILVWRTEGLPPAATVLTQLNHIARA